MPQRITLATAIAARKEERLLLLSPSLQLQRVPARSRDTFLSRLKWRLAMLSSFLIRGLGFFNDAYDLFVMNVVNVVLSEQYGPEVYTPALKSSVSAAALIGAVAGQLVFGVLADRLGRRLNMIITCVILIVGGLLCTCAYGSTPTSTIWMLVVARGVLGFGIGGEYPLSASSSAEDATSIESRNRRVALTFSLQGVGSLAAAVMGDVLVRMYAPHDSGENYPRDLEIVWRGLFGVGVVPALFVVYHRFTAEETETFAASAAQQQEQRRKSESDGSITASLRSSLTYVRIVLRHYGTRLIGTAGAWFLFDIVFYAQNLFSASMLSVVGIHDASLKQVTRQNVYVALMALPGYFVAVYFINSLGRKRMQLQGFAIMAVIFLVLSAWWEDIEHNSTAFVLLYGLALFFSNFGPNTSTFVLPAEMFPTAIRASCHGFSAAMGKFGAALGSYGFSPLVEIDGVGFHGVFLVFALICVAALPLTHFCVFDNDHTLEEMDKEFNAVMLHAAHSTGAQEGLFDEESGGLKKISAKDSGMSTSSFSSYEDPGLIDIALVSP